MSAIKEKKRRTRSLAELVPGALGEAFAAQGFAGTEIVQRWREIAGPELAARSRPLKLAWPKQPQDQSAPRMPATLMVQVESAFALELQMQTPVLLERINRYFGWACVATIRIKQGPVSERRAPPRRDPVLPASTEKRIGAAAEGFEDARLADALVRLGRAIAGSSRR